MVKKKIVLKESVSKKRKVEVSVSKNDFEVFAEGVQRLKELKVELDGLDTRGFGKQEQVIRAKLKIVSEIPSIEVGLKKLRAEIDNKYRPKKRAVVKNKEIGKIKGELPKIERKMRELGAKIDKLSVHVSQVPSSRAKRSVDSGVGGLVEVGFDNFLDELKSELSDRVKTKERQVESSLRKDLKEHGEKFKKKHSEMIKDFHVKKMKLEKEFHVKVNSGREKLNAEFKRKVAENKKRVSEDKEKVVVALKKLVADESRFKKNKEVEVAKVKEGLEKRRAEFEKRRGFEIILKKKEFVKKKSELEKKRKEFVKKKGELEKKRKELEKRKEEDSKRLVRKMEEEIIHKRKEFVDMRMGLEKRSREIEERKKVSIIRRKREFSRERAELEKRRREIERKKIGDSKKFKLNMETELKRQKVLLSGKYHKMFRDFFKQKSLEVLKSDKEKLKKKFSNAEVKERARMKVAFHDRLGKEVSVRVGKIRGGMKEEFEKNLSKKMKEHDLELKRKMKEHDLELRKKMAEHDRQLERDRRSLRAEIKKKMDRVLG